MRLTCNSSHPARLDGSNLYGNAIRHCKRLVLRLIYYSVLDKIHVNTYKSP
nr:MAG TPA: hypothetical protein [Bacteriophage sp.]